MKSIAVMHCLRQSHRYKAALVSIKINVNVNVHVHVDSPVGSANCTINTPGTGTHNFTYSSLGRIQHLHQLLQFKASHYNGAFLFHQVPITAA